ncbi:FAD-dependent oxidoreductase [Streptomyces rubradiris]|uniref:FAD-dependent oxidoreductase n=1 Tax=Streptomyces rubradiris TaxID=285531 RepID=UPI0036EA3255
MNERVDVVVLGLGHAGGYVTSAPAESGLDVVGIEPGLVRGGRLPPGCFADVMTAGSVSGFSAARLAAGAAAVGRAGLVRGRGRLSGPRRVTVGGRTFPAQLFARFRCAVTVVERRPRLLPREEPEASALAERALRRDGVTALGSTGVSEVGHDGTGFTVRPDGGREPPRARRLLVTMERQAGLVGLGADTVGLDARAGTVPTDGRMRAGRGLWAVGDVTGRVPADAASYQAEVAVRDILGWPGPGTGYGMPARLVLTDPETAAVGLTERQARNRRLRVRTSPLPVDSFGSRGPRGRRREGFVKLVEDADRGVLVGATSAGPAGAEVLYGLNVAVHAALSAERPRSRVPALLPFHRTVEAAPGGLG